MKQSTIMTWSQINVKFIFPADVKTVKRRTGAIALNLLKIVKRPASTKKNKWRIPKWYGKFAYAFQTCSRRTWDHLDIYIYIFALFLTNPTERQILPSSGSIFQLIIISCIHLPLLRCRFRGTIKIKHEISLSQPNLTAQKFLSFCYIYSTNSGCRNCYIFNPFMPTAPLSTAIHTFGIDVIRANSSVRFLRLTNSSWLCWCNSIW